MGGIALFLLSIMPPESFIYFLRFANLIFGFRDLAHTNLLFMLYFFLIWKIFNYFGFTTRFVVRFYFQWFFWVVFGRWWILFLLLFIRLRNYFQTFILLVLKSCLLSWWFIFLLLVRCLLPSPVSLPWLDLLLSLVLLILRFVVWLSINLLCIFDLFPISPVFLMCKEWPTHLFSQLCKLKKEIWVVESFFLFLLLLLLKLSFFLKFGCL